MSTESNTVHLTIKPTEPCAIASTDHGAEADAVIFNLSLIEKLSPELAANIRQLQKEVSDIPANAPQAKPEEITVAKEQFKELANKLLS